MFIGGWDDEDWEPVRQIFNRYRELREAHDEEIYGNSSYTKRLEALRINPKRPKGGAYRERNVR